MRYTSTSLKKRVRIFLACVCCALVIISGRLVYVQLFQAQSLRLLAAEQWYRDLPLEARRGAIFDRNGVLMTQSTLTYCIYVRPVAVQDASQVARVLADNLAMDYDFLLRRVQNKSQSEHLIKMQVEKDVAIRIVQQRVPGIYISQTFRRDYPLGATAGQVLGIVSIDGRGQAGIEAFYDSLLRGVNGRSAVASDLRGRPRACGTEFFVPSLPGHNMVLNIDAQIQRLVQDVLEKAHYEQGAQNVSALVMCIQSGGVVASASAPFFDMNDQPRNDAMRLMNEIKNLPMVNVLEPGSTFKIITLAAALEEGLTDENERFHCAGFHIIDGERVRCWKAKGHGSQTLAEGVMQSCNKVFMELGMRLGVERFYDYLRRFGIGRKTGIDTYGEPSGLLLDPRYVRPVDLARIAFGQAIAVSPIQFQNVLNAIVGDGILRTPRIVNNIPTLPGAVTAPNRGRIVSPETARRVREMMISVVNTGSGKHAGHAGFNIGGKTGTAQKYRDGIIDQGKYISSFIGFIEVAGVARYSVFVMVDEPSKAGYYGSIVAAPYVGQIFAGIIQIMNLPADPNLPGPFIPEWLLPPNAPPPLVTLPDVSGMQLFEAVAKLQTMGFFVQVSGTGVTANRTFPNAGSRLRNGEPVVIVTG